MCNVVYAKIPTSSNQTSKDTGKSCQGFLSPLVPISLLPSPLQSGSHHDVLGKTLVSVRFLICLLFWNSKTRLETAAQNGIPFLHLQLPQNKINSSRIFLLEWPCPCWSSSLICVRWILQPSSLQLALPCYHASKLRAKSDSHREQELSCYLWDLRN